MPAYVLEPFKGIVRRVVLIAMLRDILDQGGPDSFEFGACGRLYRLADGIGIGNECRHILRFTSAALQISSFLWTYTMEHRGLKGRNLMSLGAKRAWTLIHEVGDGSPESVSAHRPLP